MYEYQDRATEKEREKMYDQYFDLIRKAAYLGYPGAQYERGQQYEDVNYLSIQNPKYNPKKFVYWYTKTYL